MDRQRSRFVEGAAKNNVESKLSNSIFDLVNEFAGYGFNKSHAAAYAMISFRTAYLKAVYPTEFVAATMSLDITNVEKLAQFYQEAKRMGVEIVPPSVNVSFADFEVKDGAVLYALGALKNVGVEAMRHVVVERETHGPFLDLAFDCLEPNRARAQASASILQSIGARAAQERASSQVSLFGDAVENMVEPDLPTPVPWEKIEQLDHELTAIGFLILI